MKLKSRFAAYLMFAAIALPMSAEAHRAWLYPSATVLSGKDNWVTVDAAISNDLFYFEHNPMRLDNLKIFAPDGTSVAPQNANTGKYRSTFDVQLTQPGTYKMAVVNEGLFAQYQLNGERKRWRGTKERLSEIPSAATDVKVTQSQSRVEIFVTSGKPSEKALEPTKQGLELVAVTHPNNLVSGETAKFKLLLDGEPAKGVEVAVIQGGIRYRDKLNEVNLKTDDEGIVTVKWTAPGMYWVNATVRDQKATVPNAERRASYTTTVEVLPE
ncbi:nickel uptake substrate-specific transmembrane region [Variibacter gotjawalensis]|uniref:Nickel uptake substrate-specific transmembrane region n=1 Tax=Variibacter gotjawalensis TaxID=1333996 RepID=A0A0S3PZQ5_9BRAD|nr:DUF4198 domain-containing protein [Variibacter gotjawalensis]NIK47268.1 putative GH25 family protein [Variibacter gotjawalensis]RZS49168.1 putative GH25 family protein [Variibacter gotjawalensis]BAT61430.1 nickel uptake substrate-specific transmembrane region [Variibacter gotjawalensis]